MSPLTAIERRLPKAAVVVIAGLCATVLATGTAVAVSRSGDGAKPAPKAAGSPSASPGPKAGKAAKPPAPKKPKKPATVAGYLLPLQSEDDDYERLSDSAAGTGTIDLTKAAAIDSGDNTPSQKDKDLLRSIGFVRGHSRVWDDGDHTVVVYVYEWRTSAGARAFVKGVQLVHERRGDDWKPSTPNSTGSCRTQDGEVVDGEVLHVERHTYIIAVIREGTCKKHTEVLRIATMQYDYARSVA